MSFKEFIKEHIEKLYSNKDYLTREIYIGIYSKTYDFCTAKISFKSDVSQYKINLYNTRLDFYNFIVKNVEEVCNSISYKLLQSNNIIDLYNKEFQNFLICSKILDNILEYFNRVFISESGNSQYLIILSKCKNIWIKNVLNVVNDKIIHKILSILKEEREVNYSCDLYPIKKLLQIYNDIHLNITNCEYKELDIRWDDKDSIYKKYFEDKYLENCSEYYKFICDTSSIETFIDKSKKYITFEKEISNKILNTCSHKKILDICIKNFIIDNNIFIGEELLKSLIDKKDDISEKIYNFYLEYCCDSILNNDDSVISEVFDKYCKSYLNSNLKIILSKKDTDFKTFATSIIKTYDLFLNKIKTVFKNNKIIFKSFETSFKECINENSSKYCNYICKYINYIIKLCIKESIDLEENNEFLSLLNIVKFTYDKDYLENYYIRYLAQRLLNDSNLDYEYQVSRKLKMLFGNEFTNKINTMISDINISKKLSEEFKKSNDVNYKKKLTPIIATHFIWKLPKNYSVEYPVDLKENIDSFSQFYDTKFKGRKLVWNNNFIKGEVTSHCFNKTYIFNASLNQINILNKFNSKDTYSIDFFEKNYNKNALDSLIKIKVLKKNDESIIINPNFKSKKIKQNIYNLEAKKEVIKKTNEKIDLNIDRGMLIQSCLVRVMKTRKKLDHNQLISQTMSQIDRFCPKITDVKKNIEKLLEKEYIERDPINRNIYNYLA